LRFFQVSFFSGIKSQQSDQHHHNHYCVKNNSILFPKKSTNALLTTYDYYKNFILDRCAVIVFGIITLIAGVILASVPWLNYFILKVRH